VVRHNREAPVHKILAIAALAAITVASSLLATTDEANAQRRWNRAFVGIGAGVIAGATIATNVPVYVEGKCTWVDQYDRQGNFLGRVRVCDTTPN
jgi:hypothetical protein